jgi:hypothetical protein
MKTARLGLIALLLMAALSAAGREHAYGPWNIDASAALDLETNNNVFYDETGAVSDTAWHINPKLGFEYEQLGNSLFLAELDLDSSIHSQYSEANITQTIMRIEARPVRSGGYAIFGMDYEMRPNYAPDGGLLRTAINKIKLGGGFAGLHLDTGVNFVIERGSFSPGAYSQFNYGRSGLEGEVRYRVNSLYWIGGLGFGSLNYADNLMSDGRYTMLTGGVGKEITPKTKVEFRANIYSEVHAEGDNFSGLLFGFKAVHTSYSGKGELTVGIDREVVPSTIMGVNFGEVTSVHFASKNEITQQFSDTLDLKFQSAAFDARSDRTFELDFEGVYLFRKNAGVNFGFRNASRTSSEAT